MTPWRKQPLADTNTYTGSIIFNLHNSPRPRDPPRTTNHNQGQRNRFLGHLLDVGINSFPTSCGNKDKPPIRNDSQKRRRPRSLRSSEFIPFFLDILVLREPSSCSPVSADRPIRSPHSTLSSTVPASPIGSSHLSSPRQVHRALVIAFRDWAGRGGTDVIYYHRPPRTAL